MKKRMALCGLALAVACANFGVQAGDGVVLTPGRTEVLIAPEAPKTVQFAAIDLTNHLARIFGAEVPVVTAPGRRPSRFQVLGQTRNRPVLALCGPQYRLGPSDALFLAGHQVKL